MSMTKKISNIQGRLLHDRDGKVAGCSGVAISIAESKEDSLSVNELVEIEVKRRNEVENKLDLCNKVIDAMQAVMAIGYTSSEAVIKKVISSVSSIFSIPYVAVGTVEKMTLTVFQNVNGEYERIEDLDLENHPCGCSFKSERFKHLQGDFKHQYSLFKDSSFDFKACCGMPILNSNGLTLGGICLSTNDDKRVFTDWEINQIETFANCIGSVLERKIMENQLTQSKEMKLLGQMTSGVAHEVRNPLNGILVTADVLGRELEGHSEYGVFIGHIRNQTLKLTALMNDLLGLAKPVELNCLFASPVVELISSALVYWKQSSRYRERNVRVAYRQEDRSVLVRVDLLKFEQVIVNLLENGCAHSSQDQEVVIDIKCDETFAIIQVVDFGSGIRPEHIGRLFEPFFTTRSSGTGLGLGIVKGIVESHGGTIDIRNNTESSGVTAEIKIPLVKE